MCHELLALNRLRKLFGFLPQVRLKYFVPLGLGGVGCGALEHGHGFRPFLRRHESLRDEKAAARFVVHSLGVNLLAEGQVLFQPSQLRHLIQVLHHRLVEPDQILGADRLLLGVAPDRRAGLERLGHVGDHGETPLHGPRALDEREVGVEEVARRDRPLADLLAVPEHRILGEVRFERLHGVLAVHQQRLVRLHHCLVGLGLSLSLRL